MRIRHVSPCDYLICQMARTTPPFPPHTYLPFGLLRLPPLLASASHEHPPAPLELFVLGRPPPGSSSSPSSAPSARRETEWSGWGGGRSAERGRRRERRPAARKRLTGACRRQPRQLRAVGRRS
ncbi:hypothetical protein GUJ93_ZPchr0008g14084 [Zizania palustris]|uniref:Uncharacterized protein n=1 Tax=Zizania palustris TaxID=103762 RepID=A0A8J5V4A1_ZIZPA|nr:hypothetical protein GUJ93_ZPchr0008g14084 [Zizania palustris]